MTEPWRYSAVAERHKELGSNLEEWNGMPTAWTYDADINDGFKAIRQGAGLMDISGLNCVHVVGPHAEIALNHAMTREASTIYPGKAAYTTFLDERGTLVDDGIVYRTGVNDWLVVHGSGTAHEQILKSSAGKDLDIRFDNDIQILSLQGPLSIKFLKEYVPGLENLKYFHHTSTTLFGYPVMISRTGYTGSRGYEIYCKYRDALAIWDTILEEGKATGIIPVQFKALDMFRTEMALLFYPEDMSQFHPFEDQQCGDSLWELGLTFTVSKGKEGFRGSEEHYRLQGKERFKLFGIELDSGTLAEGGDKVLDSDGNQVGVVTCGMQSPITGRSLALARLDVAFAVPDKEVQVQGENGTSKAVTKELPFEESQAPKKESA